MCAEDTRLQLIVETMRKRMGLEHDPKDFTKKRKKTKKFSKKPVKEPPAYEEGKEYSAEEFKEFGNSFFRKKKFQQALELY